MNVDIDAPERMNLLGLIVAALLRRNAAGAARLRGSVAITAGRMAVTLRFSDGGVRVVRGADAGADARVAGALATVLDVALGRTLWRALLSRRLRIGGRLLLLARVLPALRVAE